MLLLVVYTQIFFSPSILKSVEKRCCRKIIRSVLSYQSQRQCLWGGGAKNYCYLCRLDLFFRV